MLYLSTRAVVGQGLGRYNREVKKTWVEVDQSGRVEDLSTGSAVAFSGRNSAALFISAGQKRRIITFLRRTSFIAAKDLPAVIFNVLVFDLIQKSRIDVLKIDEEYTGKNALIEETLKKLFLRNHIKSNSCYTIWANRKTFCGT